MRLTPAGWPEINPPKKNQRVCDAPPDQPPMYLPDYKSPNSFVSPVDANVIN